MNNTQFTQAMKSLDLTTTDLHNRLGWSRALINAMRRGDMTVTRDKAIIMRVLQAEQKMPELSKIIDCKD